jgi:hypothetical protein
LNSEANLGQKLKALSEKQSKAKMTGGVAQTEECLPSKYEGLSSTPVLPKIKQNKTEKQRT